MSVRKWFWAILALALLAGGCERKRGHSVHLPLHEAAAAGRLHEVQSLIARGSGVNTRDEQGRTPLHMAAACGRLEVVRTLIRCGARVDAIDELGRSPATAAMLHDHKEVVEALVNEGAAMTLHLAAYLGQIQQAAELIRRGADVNARSEDGLMASWYPASDSGRFPDDRLFEGRARQYARTVPGYTVLHLAAMGGHAQMVQWLLTQGADPNVPALDGWSLLHCAVARSHRDIVDLLLAGGANMDARTDLGVTALHLAVIRDDADMTELLLAKGAGTELGDRDGDTPLHVAVREGNTKLVKILVSGGADLNAKGSSIHDYATPIEIAVMNGWIEVVDAMLSVRPDVGPTNDAVRMSLHWAIGSNYYRGVKAVIDRDHPEADPSDWDAHGRLVHEIREKLMVRMMEVLLAHGADVNAADATGITPLHLACSVGFRDVTELLLAKGANVNARTTTPYTSYYYGHKAAGVTPLHEATGHEEGIVELLLSHGADLDAADEEGETPLHYAIRRDNPEVVELLIAQGADVNARDNAGATPLVKALLRGHVDVAKRLIAVGARRVNMKGLPAESRREGIAPDEPLLHTALESSSRMPRYQNASTDGNDADYRQAWVGLLLANGADPNERDESGDTALHVAMDVGDEASAQLLLAYGADVNAKNHAGTTPLHLAASRSEPGLAALLLASGADVNTRASDGDTPSHNAALRGHREVVEVLLAYGADVTLTNSRGRTPADEANRRGHEEIVQLLTAGQRADR